jgi:hypothetical protein
MSKHSERRERRGACHNRLDAELDHERPFVDRVLSTLNHRGMDIGPDGNPIRADFWRYIAARQKTDLNTARAGLSLVDKAVNLIRVHRS